MSIGAIIVYGLAFAYLPFLIAGNICAMLKLTDKGTLITSGIVSLVSVIGAFLVPEDMRMYAFGGLAILILPLCVAQFFKK